MESKVIRIRKDILSKLYAIDSNVNVAASKLMERYKISIDYDYLADEVSKRVVKELKR